MKPKTKVRSIRMAPYISNLLDSICTRNGDISWHTEQALRAYKPIKKLIAAKSKTEVVLSQPEAEYSQVNFNIAAEMFGQIKDEYPSLTAKVESWAEGIRKLNTIDGHTHQEIVALWLWCRNHGFYRKIVRSPLKFRTKDKDNISWWDRLSAEKRAGESHGNNQQSHKQTARQRVAEATHGDTANDWATVVD